ncbi:hypothetical protein B0A54_17892 [Friedmanniomyces endolithicus]|uniref:Uncharacterized protein n=1 Tax=Friedmanniomyces endolithicus TaxID=329885 RepID=A0A4U0TP46_9PEZI|nr:hypothetical protein B0A54_17892 [Friedmanniomyces endolithicus]
MLSIKPSTQGWMEPGNFNSSLSAMIWVVQLLIFHHCAREAQQGRGKTLTLLQQYCDRILQQTVETPMGEILRWRLLLFHVSKNTVGDHEAAWDEEEQVLTYEDTELHMHQVATLISSEFRQCYRLLYDDLFLCSKKLHRMHSWVFRDGADVDTVGWNFTKHRDNARLLEGSECALLNHIQRSGHLCHLFLTNDRRSPIGLSWRDTTLAGYESTVQEFLKRLAVLIHVSEVLPLFVEQIDLPAQTHTNALVLDYLLLNENSVAELPAPTDAEVLTSDAERFLNIVSYVIPQHRPTHRYLGMPP